jgi:cell division protein FtsI/penicillin-binding protein 2
MGYGIAVTGLQIANAYAVLANGGKTVAPHLVSKIVSTNGVASIYEPKEQPKQVVSDKTSKAIALLMKEALSSVGKNNSYDLEGLDLAGTISSMQIPVKGGYSKTDFNVTAAGFFPVANPKWVLVIGFTKPHPQFLPNKVSLPVFVDIARKITSDSQTVKLPQLAN